VEEEEEEESGSKMDDEVSLVTMAGIYTFNSQASALRSSLEVHAYFCHLCDSAE